MDFELNGLRMALIMRPGQDPTKVMGHLPGEQAARKITGARPENLHSRNPTGVVDPRRVFVGNSRFLTLTRGTVGCFGFRAGKQLIVPEKVRA